MLPTQLHKHDAVSHGKDSPDAEIDLREFFGVLIKRRWIILSTFAISIIAATAWIQTWPKMYEISMFIEPPSQVEALGSSLNRVEPNRADPASSLKATIEAGAYNKKILDGLHLSNFALQFSVYQPKDTRLIKVTLTQAHDRVEIGVRLLSKLLEVLSQRYESDLSEKRNRIDNQIKTLQSQIETKENDIKSKTALYQILDEREMQSAKDMKESKTNAENLISRAAATYELQSKNELAAMAYSSTIQQNLGYFSQLQNDLTTLRYRKESVNATIDSLKSSITETKLEIKNLEITRDALRNVLVIQEPFVSPDPLNLNKKRNLLLAGLAGLTLGTLLALLIEHWSNIRPT